MNLGLFFNADIRNGVKIEFIFEIISILGCVFKTALVPYIISCCLERSVIDFSIEIDKHEWEPQ